jgi:hypothetical protein
MRAKEMKVFSIMPICARNRPDASLPGCYNQPDPLSSHAAARIRFQKPGPHSEPAGRTRTSDLPRLGKRLSTKPVPTFPDTGRGAGLARALAPIGRHMTAPRIADPLGESRRPDCGQTCELEKGRASGHIRGMRTGLPILLSVALLAAAILLVFRDELHAHSEPVPECGFWGDMSAGMSCR